MKIININTKRKEPPRIPRRRLSFESFLVLNIVTWATFFGLLLWHLSSVIQ